MPTNLLAVHRPAGALLRAVTAGTLAAGTLAVGTLAAGSLSLGLVAAAVSANPLAAAAATTPANTSYHSGQPVDVLYAGSLVNIMEDHVGPGFHAATGDGFEGFSDGSKALAAQIKGKLRPADVFISASPAVDKTLEGSTNGNWLDPAGVKTFAYSYLVIGYNPHGRFAHQLETKPWYTVVGEKGFVLGRTDPATDPKGVLAVTALDEAAARYHQPSLKAIATETSNVFPETDLVGRLQAGDIDAGFFYTVEAKAAGIPTVALNGFALHATYTIAVVNHAPHPAAAQAFVSYMLGASGTRILDQEGLTTLK